MSPLQGFEILDCLFSIIISSLTGLVFSGLDFKVAKSRTLAPAPDCSGNPSPSPTSPQGERNWILKKLNAKRDKEGLDWNVKRGVK